MEGLTGLAANPVVVLYAVTSVLVGNNFGVTHVCSSRGMKLR